MFTLINPKSVWVLAFIDESKAGEIQVGEPADVVLRSHPGQRLRGKVARIEPESDRVNEERRVEIVYENLPDTFYLGEQAEVYIATVRLPQALLVPEAAIVGLAKNRGTVWTVEDGSLRAPGGARTPVARRTLRDHRRLAGQGASSGAIAGGLRVGRAATIAEEPSR